MSGLAGLPASEIRQKIASKEVSAVEYLEACLARVEQLNGTLNAIVRSENEPSRTCSEVAPNLIHSSPKPVWTPAVIIESSTRPLVS